MLKYSCGIILFYIFQVLTKAIYLKENKVKIWDTKSLK